MWLWGLSTICCPVIFQVGHQRILGPNLATHPQFHEAVVRVYYGGRNVMMNSGANGPLPFDLSKGCPTRYLNDVD